jgi:hypothetical protein
MFHYLSQHFQEHAPEFDQWRKRQGIITIELF